MMQEEILIVDDKVQFSRSLGENLQEGDPGDAP
jgi:hypothetical protein